MLDEPLPNGDTTERNEQLVRNCFLRLSNWQRKIYGLIKEKFQFFFLKKPFESRKPAQHNNEIYYKVNSRKIWRQKWVTDEKERTTNKFMYV